MLSGSTVPKDSVLFLDPIVKDQARMGSSNMPGGSTPVSSASMMSGQFCCLLLVLQSVSVNVWEGEFCRWGVGASPATEDEGRAKKTWVGEREKSLAAA